MDISLNEIKQILGLENAGKEQAEKINSILDQHIKHIAKRIRELDHLRMQFIELKGKCKTTQQNKKKKNLMKTLRTTAVRFVQIK